jgi:ComF family protein
VKGAGSLQAIPGHRTLLAGQALRAMLCRDMLAQVLLDALLDLVLPPRCAGCGDVGAGLCATCIAQIRWISDEVCRRCGRPLVKEARCLACQRDPLAIDGIVAAAEYSGPVRAAVLRFKYRYRRDLARALEQVLLRGTAARLPPADLVIPVPLHPSRRRARGFNQAEDLARALAGHLGCHYDSHALVRVLLTPPQAGLSRLERRRNLAGAFRAQPPRVAGRRVIVVDDVCTTGSTLEACAEALRVAGTLEVWGCTVARTAALPG